MTETITVVGTVGTDPTARTTPTGRNVTHLRLACTGRIRDASTGQWRDGDTNWYTVNAWNELGRNVHESIRKRERVIVTGRLRVRDWENEDRKGTEVEIVADSVGHDLRWGTTRFTRAAREGEEQGSAAPSPDQEWAAAAPEEGETPF